MSNTQGEQAPPSAMARAEVLLGNLGRRLDLFTAQAGQRMHNIADAIREEADRADRPATNSGEKAHPSGIARTEASGKVAMERAEEAVDRMGHYLTQAAFQIQRASARLREEGEDIWAEAQNIRHERSRPVQ